MDVGPDFEVIVDPSAPKGRRIVRRVAGPAPVAATAEDARPATGVDAMTDDELRAHVQAVTGNKPHHNAGRAKLLAMLKG